jgi:hypothetical protein
MAQLHLLFPVVVYEDTYENSSSMKDVFSKIIFQYLNERGMSDENTGHVTMHHDNLLKPLFGFATAAAKKFVAQYMIDSDLFDYHVVKSWMNMIEHRETPQHNHADAHISFVYYVNLPKTNDMPITFCNYPNRYEPFPFMSKVNTPTEWNAINSYAWSFAPQEGTIFVFPSTLSHYVEKHDEKPETGIHNSEDFMRHRISIAGDILLTYKDKSAKSLGLQPIKNWRTF